ncbi:MAG TPA: prepilin-type N-terminal cleavage/methylation domain-containing protein [Candidatus Saccharimonadales bacterium]
MESRQQSGYTLIELLLYITILSSLLLAVSSFFTATASMRVRNQAENDVTAQASAIMERITFTIRNADSITAPTTGATGAQLNLVVPTAGLSPTIFELNGPVLQIREGTGAAVALSSPSVTVSNLQFKNVTKAGTAGSVQVTFTVSKVNAGNREEFNFQRTFTATGTLR